MHPYTQNEVELFSSCTLCPRNCKVNRFSHKLGYCKSDAGFNISSICAHQGEEPVISGKKGICNVFFPHCNLQCVFCQNHDISSNRGEAIGKQYLFEEVVGKICNVLDETENMLGFVSPSHYIPQMLAIIRGVHQAGKRPVVVYNTNGYDAVNSLQMLEGIVDIYLPDFKYMNSSLAFTYSHARNYPAVAAAALKEMYRQKGSTLVVNDAGLAESGIIVRHLVLPGEADQSIDVLKYLAEEISPKLHISLMSQYFPTAQVQNHPTLNRILLPEEYQKVLEAFDALGFYRGWIQDLGSHASYRPNFFDDQPFGN